MSYRTEQVVNGLMKYADNEIITQLPTSGKWLMGTAITLASDKVNNAVDVLSENAIVKMLGIIDEDGNVDVEALINAMKSTADKYGKMTVEVPLIGRLTFSSSDIDRLRTYII